VFILLPVLVQALNHGVTYARSLHGESSVALCCSVIPLKRNRG